MQSSIHTYIPALPSLHQSNGHSRIHIHIWTRQVLHMISIIYNHRQSGQWSLYHIPSNCTRFDKYVYKVHLMKAKEEERRCIIKCTYHCISMSTYHQISNTHSKATHNLRIMTVASPPSPDSSHCPAISDWWMYTIRLNVHCMHSGQAQAEDHQSQDQAHYKAIWTVAFGCLSTILHAYLRWPSLLYPIHWLIHMLHLHWGLPRYEVKNMHLSLPIISGLT